MNKDCKEGILGVLKTRCYSLFTNYRKRVKNVHIRHSAEPSLKQVLVEKK